MSTNHKEGDAEIARLNSQIYRKQKKIDYVLALMSQIKVVSTKFVKKT